MAARKDISDYDVCKAYDEWTKNRGGVFVTDILMRKFTVPEKVAEAACERADKHGLVDYGVSLRSGWLTEKGEALLKGGE